MSFQHELNVSKFSSSLSCPSFLAFSFLASKYSVESIIPTTATKTARTSSTMLSDVLCPMPSTVTRVSVKNGDVVKKGDLLLVVEAMKMEVRLS